MLCEESMAITKEKELDSLVVLKFNPDIASIIKETINTLKINITIFLEKKSTPRIFAIASKFANFNAPFFLLLKEKKCIRKKSGITNNKKRYCGCETENII